MKIISGLNDETIESLVKAFAGTTNDVVDEIKQEYGLETGNFKNGGVWDIRFRRIKQVALENGLIVLTKEGEFGHLFVYWIRAQEFYMYFRKRRT